MPDENKGASPEEAKSSATEAAATLAEQEKISLEEIKGTGADGAVTKDDVEKEIRARAKAEAEQAEEPTRYSRDEILGGGHALTGYSRVVLAGALHGDDRKTFTAAQAKEAARKFLGREVTS